MTDKEQLIAMLERAEISYRWEKGKIIVPILHDLTTVVFEFYKHHLEDIGAYRD